MVIRICEESWSKQLVVKLEVSCNAAFIISRDKPKNVSYIIRNLYGKIK